MRPLTCYPVHPENGPIDIRPAPRRRDWMDATNDSFAYRCLPLVMANMHGWQICSPTGFSAQWNGGHQTGDVSIRFDDGETSKIASHFGYGILTSTIDGIFRTEPGYSLWISGPTNEFKDAIQPMSATIETDWMPFVFTMNWKFTRPGHAIRFEKGEPFCNFFPVRHADLEAVDPAFAPLETEPALKKQFLTGHLRRNARNIVEHLKGIKDSALDFQSWYKRGKMPDGSQGPDSHRKKLTLRPFQRPPE